MSKQSTNKSKGYNTQSQYTTGQHQSTAIAELNSYGHDSVRPIKFDGSTAGGTFARVTLARYELGLEAEELGCKRYLDGEDRTYLISQDEVDKQKPDKEKCEAAMIADMRKELEIAKLKEWNDIVAASKNDWLYYAVSKTPMVHDILNVDPSQIKQPKPGSLTVSTDSADPKAAPEVNTADWFRANFARRVKRFSQDYPETPLIVLPENTTPVPDPLSIARKKEIARTWILKELKKDYYDTLYANPPVLGLTDGLKVDSHFGKLRSNHIAFDEQNKKRAATVKALIHRFYATNVLEPYQVEMATGRHAEVLQNIGEKYGQDSGESVPCLTRQIADMKFTKSMSYEHFYVTLKLLFTQLNLALMKDKFGNNFDITTHAPIAKEISWNIKKATIKDKGWEEFDLYPSQQKLCALQHILGKRDSDCNKCFDEVIHIFDTNIEYKDKKTFYNLLKMLDYQNKQDPQTGSQAKGYTKKKENEKKENSNNKPTQEDYDAGRACRDCDKW